MCCWLSRTWGPASLSVDTQSPGAGDQLGGQEDLPLPSEPSGRRHLQGTDRRGLGSTSTCPSPAFAPPQTVFGLLLV